MSKGMNIDVYDPKLQLSIPKQIVITYFNEFKNNADGSTTVVIPSSQIARGVTEEEINSFHELQGLIGICATNAEVINRRLLSLLNGIQNKQHKNEDLSGLDFMQLRDRLSTILKVEKKINEIGELSTAGRMKAFTKSFYRYITDRNIYTHGELSLNIVGGEFVIRAKVEGKDSHYKIDRTILESNLSYYKELLNTLNKLDTYFKDKK